MSLTQHPLVRAKNKVRKLESELSSLKADFRELQKQLLPKDREIAQLTAILSLRTELLKKAEAERDALAEALNSVWNRMPQDQYIEDHDAAAASTFRQIKPIIKAALDAARKEGV